MIAMMSFMSRLFAAGCMRRSIKNRAALRITADAAVCRELVRFCPFPGQEFAFLLALAVKWTAQNLGNNEGTLRP
jgi:hypothetical protein